MDHFSSFLKKFKNIEVPHKEARERFSKISSQSLGRDIPISQIRISKRVLYVDIDPIFKSEIFLQKGKLLEALNQDSTRKEDKVIDIR